MSIFITWKVSRFWWLMRPLTNLMLFSLFVWFRFYFVVDVASISKQNNIQSMARIREEKKHILEKRNLEARTLSNFHHSNQHKSHKIQMNFSIAGTLTFNLHCKTNRHTNSTPSIIAYVRTCNATKRFEIQCFWKNIENCRWRRMLISSTIGPVDFLGWFFDEFCSFTSFLNMYWLHFVLEICEDEHEHTSESEC